MLTRCQSVWARARWGDRYRHSVYISSGAQDEEVGVRAVEEAEPVMEGSDDSVRDRLGDLVPGGRAVVVRLG